MTDLDSPGRILICTAKVPFVSGGAEVLTETLAAELGRRGFEVDVISIPFSWGSRDEILRSALVWRLASLERIEERDVDLVIATRFPSYVVRHPNKVVWLVHQFRQIYDLYGTPYSDFGSDDGKLIESLRRIDQRTLGEARRLFSISKRTAERLEHYNDLRAEVLYPPPKLGERYSSGEYGDYVLSVSRLDPIKRIDLLVEAMARTQTPVRCLIPGRGRDRQRLEARIGELGLAGRVELLGQVDDERLLELYSGALAVYFSPYDEDYGYVSVEAFKAARPVLTFADSGGVLELVADDVNGFVCQPAAVRQMAARIDQLYQDRGLARRLGQAGRATVESIGWERVIPALVGQAEG